MGNLLEAKRAPTGSIPTHHEAIAKANRRLIVDAVRQSNRNYTQAAKKLGLRPNYLYRLIRNLVIKDTL